MKKQMVCDNQNSLERATVELKKVNISIIKYPLFSVSLRTLLAKNKSSIYSVLCDFSFPVKRCLFCINGFYLSDTVHKQHIFFFFYLPAVASILADWETAPLYQSALN